MVEKSDEFDKCMVNRRNVSYQNFALREFWYCIFYGYNLKLSGFVTLCWDMKSGVLSLDYPCKKDAPENKDPPEGKKLPKCNLGHVYRRLYHRHRDKLPAVTLT